MTFKTQMAVDVSNVFFNDTEFADDGVYNSADATIVNKAIKVILDLGADLGGTDYGVADLVSVTLKLVDVPRPAIYDTWKSDASGIVYTLGQRIGGGGEVVTMTAEEDARQIPQAVR